MLKRFWNARWRDDPLGAALGSLEREVMDIVWRTGAVTVRAVQAALPRPVAYTTVMTTLDRLFKKGFVTRARTGRAFAYEAFRTREQTEAALAAGMVSGLFSSGGALPIMSNLVDALGSQDGGAALLDALEEMVREKRRSLEQSAGVGLPSRAGKSA